MTTETAQDDPAMETLASILMSDIDLQTCVRINDFVYRSPDISHSYMVTTADGNLVINTGATGSGAMHRKRYRRVSDAPIQYIVLTQSHLDHVSGINDLRDPDTTLVTHARFREILESRRMLAPFWQRRKDRVLGPLLGSRMVNEFIDLDSLQPDITYDRSLDLELGGRRFRLLHAPGGETLDSTIIWMPDEGILFVGNMFGPILGDLPNLYTIRGERIRSAKEFVRCVDMVLALEPETVLEGHGSDAVDLPTLRSRATRVRDAVQWLHDWTIDGMNAGKELRTLMREVQLPAALDVPQRHGKVAWCVRAVWEEYVGWFEFDSTTSLYDVPATAVHPDLVELAGGTEPFVERAVRRLGDGALMEALYLAEIALGSAPGDQRALGVVVDVHERLLDATGRTNYFETLWLDSCVTEARQRMAPDQTGMEQP
jgi:alkyl sulfatase BDS1-like metallo-beta-lactamase superfamily hydrolase